MLRSKCRTSARIMRASESDTVRYLQIKTSPRRWHQYVVGLEELFFEKNIWNPEKCCRGTYALKLLRPVMKNLNSTKLIEIVRRCAVSSYKGLEAARFLSQWFSALENSEEGLLMYKSIIAFHLLEDDMITEAETLLFEFTEGPLNNAFGLPSQVEAEFHWSASLYSWKVGNLFKFYEHAMLYLKSRKGEAEETDVGLAENLCKAVLLSPKINSFTELLQSSIIENLKAPRETFLKDLVVLTNSGDVNLFQSFINQNRSKLIQYGLDEKVLLEKLTVFALLELAFLKPRGPNGRVLTFKEIRDVSQTEEDVEKLLIKVMDQKLVSGVIDQVNESVRVTSLEPRLLDDCK